MVYLCRDCEHYHKYESCKNLGFCCEYNKSRIIKVPIDEARKQYSQCKTCYETSYKRESQPKKDTTNWVDEIVKKRKKGTFSEYEKKRKEYLQQKQTTQKQKDISPALKRRLQELKELRKQKEIQKQMQEVLESLKHKFQHTFP
jgi:hypothetical protein